MSVFLNSFYPLCYTKQGQEAVLKGFKPYIDGSIRREPDFESQFPAITGLCRTDKLISRLSVGDKVIYITNKGWYDSLYCWRLVAVLQVQEFRNNHSEAAEYYRSTNLPIPQNLMIPETHRKNLDESHQHNKEFKNNGVINVDKWDSAYKWRAAKYPKVAICSVYENILYLDSPLVITDEVMRSCFNRIPRAQMPPKLNSQEEIAIFDWIFKNRE